MRILKINTLGSTSFWLDKIEITQLLPQKAQAILIYCAIQSPSIKRTNLAVLFWQNYTNERAHGNLRMTIAALKKHLPDFLQITRNHIKLVGNIELDVLELQKQIKERPDIALSLYRGDFLADFYVDDSSEFENWRFQITNKLKTLVIQTYLKRIETFKAENSYQQALVIAQNLVSLDKENEQLHCLLMDLYYQLGERQAALQQFNILKTMLRETYDLEPMPSTVELYKQIQGTTRIYPANTGSFNYPKLPEFLTSFIGRETELKELEQLLFHSRLTSLVGIGGIGKTRLAVALAKRLTDKFRDKAVFVKVNPHAPFTALAETLMLSKAHVSSLPEHILNFLANKEMLLVIDIDSGSSEINRMIEQILFHAPYVSVLVSSREALNLYGETVYPVQPLQLPAVKGDLNLEDCMDNDAFQLFINRAGNANPSFQVDEANLSLLIELCERSAGIPFALELLARQVRLRSLDELALIDLKTSRFAYSQSSKETTLTEMIEWSYQHLKQDEKTVYRALSILASDWTINFVEELLPKNWADFVEQQVISLMNKGLIIPCSQKQNRFRMLEPVRDHAQGQLGFYGETEVFWELYLQYILEYCKGVMEGVRGKEQKACVEKANTEYEHIRTILSYTQKRPRYYEQHCQIITYLGWYWYYTSNQYEALYWAEPALALEYHVSAAAHAGVLAACGHAYFVQGKISKAENCHRAALKLYQAMGDMVNEAFMMFCLSAQAEDREEQFEYNDKGLMLAQTENIRWLIPNLLINRGEIYREQGDFAESRKIVQQGLQIAKSNGNEHAKTIFLVNLSDILLSTEHFQLARIYAKQAVRSAEILNESMFLAEAYGLFGEIEVALGQEKSALFWLTRSIIFARKVESIIEISIAFVRYARAMRLKQLTALVNQYLYQAALNWLEDDLQGSRKRDCWLQLCDEMFIQLVSMGVYNDAVKLYNYIQYARSMYHQLRRPCYQAIIQKHYEICQQNASTEHQYFSGHEELILVCVNHLANHQDFVHDESNLLLQNIS